MKNFRALALAALLPLTACGGSPHKPVHTVDKGTPSFFCPQVAVLQQGQTLTLFQPNRADVAARISTAQITGVSGSCRLLKAKNTVLVTVKATFLADNGPANNNAPLALPWFVALTQGDKVIQQTGYTQKLTFEGNNTTASAAAKPVRVELPNSPEAGTVQVLVSFQESQDQLAYAAAHPNASPVGGP